MLDLKSLEKEVLEELKERFMDKEYKGEVFPFEVIETTVKIITEKVLGLLSGKNFNIKPLRQGNVLLVSAQDENENTVVDGIYSVNYSNEENKPELKINNILVSIKEYPFEQEGLI